MGRPASHRRPPVQRLHSFVRGWLDLGFDLGDLELDDEEILADLRTGRD